MLRWATSLGALPLVLALFGAPSPDDPSGRCPEHRFCVYEDSDMRGGMAAFGRDDRGYRNNTWVDDDRAGPNDEVSSVVNGTERWAVLYIGRRHRGHALCVPPHGSVANLEDYEYDIHGHDFGDALSSHDLRRARPRLVTDGGPCDHRVPR